MPRQCKPVIPLTPAQQELAASNRPIVLHMLKRMGLGTHPLADDLVGEATLYLCKAARLFDASAGFTFSTYARRFILGAFAKVLAQHAAERTNQDKFLPMVASPDRGDTRMRKREEIVATIRRLIPTLAHPRDRDVLQARLAGERLKDIAARYGFCEARAGRVVERARNHLALRYPGLAELLSACPPDT